MNGAELTLRRAIADLDAIGAQWALVGGFAVSAWAEPRLTRDVDAAVAVADDGAAEAAIAGLSARGWTPITLIEQDAVGRVATVRLQPARGSTAGAVLDVLFASSGIEAELVAQAVHLEILPGLRAAVARPGHLAALKLLARDDVRRPQDAADLRSLLPVLDAAERARLRRAVTLITERGYERSRDLAAAAEELLSSLAPRRSRAPAGTAAGPEGQPGTS